MKSGDPAAVALNALLEREAPPAGAGPVAFLNPEPLPAPPPGWAARVVAVQPWKPTHDRLESARWRVADAPPSCAAAIVRLGRSRERGLADVAAALDALAPGAPLWVAGANAHGAAGTLRRVAAALGPTTIEPRRHARAARFARPASLPEAVEAWRGYARLRPIPGGEAVSAPGLFAWDRVDPGTRLLLETLPPGIAGRVADLGAGWGALARAVLARNAGIARLDAYEADALAVAAARANLADPRARVVWHDVAAGLPEAGYDWIVANPPFHDPGGTDVGAGLAFIAAAAAALRPGGRLALVANRRLPYEAALAQRFASVAPLAARAGYKVLLATR